MLVKIRRCRQQRQIINLIQDNQSVEQQIISVYQQNNWTPHWIWVKEPWETTMSEIISLESNTEKKLKVWEKKLSKGLVKGQNRKKLKKR